MTKKPKSTTDHEEHLAEPAATPAPVEDTPQPCIPPPPPSAFPWPESTEDRALLVTHTDHDRSELAKRQSAVQLEKCSVEDQKKASASHYKSVIERLEGELNTLAARVKAGGETRDVSCRWIFETAGLDNSGAWVPHPEYKTLVREDTGEVVTTAKITDCDRQASLPLGDMSDEDAERFLAEHGWTLGTDENPAEGDTPFFLIKGEGDEVNLPDCDNRNAALAAAVKHVREFLAASVSETKPTAEELRFDAIRDEGAEARRNNIKRHKAPYESPTPELQYWKAGWDAEDDRIEREQSAAGAAA